MDADFALGVDAGAHDGVDDGAEGVIRDDDTGGLVGRGTPRECVIPAAQNVVNAIRGERGI